MSKLLVIATDAADATAGAGFAQAYGLPFDILLLKGSGATDLGAAQVLTANLDHVPTADVLAGAVSQMGGGYTHFAAVSAMWSKDGLARLAGQIGAAMVTDVIAFETPTIFRRPIVAGTVIEVVEVLAEPVVLTVRPAGFPAAQLAGASPVGTVSIPDNPAISRSGGGAKAGGRPDLTLANVIVSGGRPLGDAETFERVIGALADKLGGAVGATRAAVDSGIAPNELQVGQTGKIVAPDLYIAAGISGSTQHMAGIKDSKVIVAINKDPDAPIYEFADFGLVADLFDAVPELTNKV